MTKEDALRYIKTEYERLDQVCRVDTSGIKISISSRMTRQLGCFSVKRTGFSEDLSIKISERILSDEELFLDVIRHEYAHAIVHIRHPRRRHVHDEVWKAACLEVGCEPKATRKMGDEDTPVRPRQDKYLVQCQNCGAESRYRTAGKVVKILLKKKRGQVICKRCGSTDFKLKSLTFNTK